MKNDPAETASRELFRFFGCTVCEQQDSIDGRIELPEDRHRCVDGPVALEARRVYRGVSRMRDTCDADDSQG